MTYEARFGRNLGLFSEAEQARIRAARVAIIGCGGVGGVVAVILARCGVGHFALMEPDTYEASNTNRQIACFDDTLGKNKAECIRDEIVRVNPDAQAIVHPRALTVDDLPQIADLGDVIVPVMDDWPLSLAALEAARHVKPAVFAYPVGALGRVSVFTRSSPTVAECLAVPYNFGPDRLRRFMHSPHARRAAGYYVSQGQWREEWFEQWAEARKPHAQIAPVVWMCASLGAQEVLKCVTGRWKLVAAPRYWQVTPDGACVRKFGWGRRLASHLLSQQWLLDRLPQLSNSKTLVRWLTRIID